MLMWVLALKSRSQPFLNASQEIEADRRQVSDFPTTTTVNDEKRVGNIQKDFWRRKIHFWCRENTFAQPLHGQGGRECVWGSGLIQIKWGVFSTNTQGKVNLMLYIQVNVQEIWRNSTFFIVFWWLGVHLKKLRETGEGLGLAVAWNVESLLFLSCSKKHQNKKIK